MSAIVGAALVGACLAGGLGMLLVWWSSEVADEPRQPSRRARHLVARLSGSENGQSPAEQRRRLIVSAAAAIGGAAAWLFTGWPALGLSVAGLVVVVPWVLSGLRSSTAQIELVEALQEWVRRVADLVASGTGLEQAIMRSSQSAPERLAPQVGLLVSRLQARWQIRRALYALADDVDDAAGDLVVAALVLGSELRGPGLARVLTEVAAGLSDEVVTRRKVEADRAKPRSTARAVLMITLVVLGLIGLTGDYLAPYGTPVGQVVMLVVAAMLVGSMVLLRRLAEAPRPPRLLDSAVAAQVQAGAGR